MRKKSSSRKKRRGFVDSTKCVWRALSSGACYFKQSSCSSTRSFAKRWWHAGAPNKEMKHEHYMSFVALVSPCLLLRPRGSVGDELRKDKASSEPALTVIIVVLNATIASCRPHQQKPQRAERERMIETRRKHSCQPPFTVRFIFHSQHLRSLKSAAGEPTKEESGEESGQIGKEAGEYFVETASVESRQYHSTV